MKRITAANRTNARGERACAACSRRAGRLVYLPADRFASDRKMPDGLRSSCRSCQNAQARRTYAKRGLAMDDAAWQTVLRRKQAWREARRKRTSAERADFAASIIAAIRRKGFTYDDIQALTGVSRRTMRWRVGHKDFYYVKPGPTRKLTRLLAVIGDLPDRAPKARGEHGPPHPALDLVRARLERMSYLDELEAAA